MQSYFLMVPSRLARAQRAFDVSAADSKQRSTQIDRSAWVGELRWQPVSQQRKSDVPPDDDSIAIHAPVHTLARTGKSTSHIRRAVLVVPAFTEESLKALYAMCPHITEMSVRGGETKGEGPALLELKWLNDFKSLRDITLVASTKQLSCVGCTGTLDNVVIGVSVSKFPLTRELMDSGGWRSLKFVDASESDLLLFCHFVPKQTLRCRFPFAARLVVSTSCESEAFWELLHTPGRVSFTWEGPVLPCPAVHEFKAERSMLRSVSCDSPEVAFTLCHRPEFADTLWEVERLRLSLAPYQPLHPHLSTWLEVAEWREGLCRLLKPGAALQELVVSFHANDAFLVDKLNALVDCMCTHVAECVPGRKQREFVVTALITGASPARAAECRRNAFARVNEWASVPVMERARMVRDLADEVEKSDALSFEVKLIYMVHKTCGLVRGALLRRAWPLLDVLRDEPMHKAEDCAAAVRALGKEPLYNDMEAQQQQQRNSLCIYSPASRYSLEISISENSTSSLAI